MEPSAPKPSSAQGRPCPRPGDALWDRPAGLREPFRARRGAWRPGGRRPGVGGGGAPVQEATDTPQAPHRHPARAWAPRGVLTWTSYSRCTCVLHNRCPRIGPREGPGSETTLPPMKVRIETRRKPPGCEAVAKPCAAEPSWPVSPRDVGGVIVPSSDARCEHEANRVSCSPNPA